jgi:esterase/lipase
MIWDFEKLISRRLMLWAVPSILAGSVLILFGNVFWRSFGVQAVAWGAVDGLIAWFGLHRAGKKATSPSSFSAEAQEASRIRKILWINNALDVMYVTGGAALVFFFGEESPFWRGAGWGVIIQGTFLFLFDLMHALRVPDPLQLPHLPLFTHPDHEPFRLKGGQPAAVLVHGFPGTALEMRPLGHELNKAGWTASGLRLPGFGPDLADIIEYDNQDWLKALLAECQNLRAQRHNPLLLLGYSFGGALALQAAAEIPLNGLVLIAPFTWREPAWGKALGDFFRTLLPLSVHPFRHLPIDHPLLSSQYQQYLPEIDFEDPAQREELAHFQFPLAVLDRLREVGKAGLKAAQNIQTPTLLIHSTQDPVIQTRSIQYLKSQLPGPVMLESVKGPHSLTMPQNPAFEEVSAKTLAFAERIMNT